MSLDARKKKVYAFRPVRCDPLVGCYVELSGELLHGFQFAPRGNWHLPGIQNRLVFDIARDVLHVDTGYSIEKALLGNFFLTDAPSRWWERLAQNRLNVPRALARGDPAAKRWMSLLSAHTNAADRALAMPLPAIRRHSLRASKRLRPRACIAATLSKRPARTSWPYTRSCWRTCSRNSAGVD